MNILINAKSGAKAVTPEKVRSLVEAGKLNQTARVASIDDGKTWITVAEALEQSQVPEEVVPEAEEPVSEPGRKIKIKSTKGLVEISEEKVQTMVSAGKLSPTRSLLTINDGVTWISFNKLNGKEDEIEVPEEEIEPEKEVAVQATRKPAKGGGQKKPAPVSNGQGMAITSLILGLFGLVFCWNPIGWLCGILALTFGILAIRKHNGVVKSGGEPIGGKGMAIAGVALSLFSLATTTLIVLVVMAAVGAAAHEAKKIADDPTGAAANAIVSSAQVAEKVAQDPQAQALAADALKAGVQIAEKVAQDPRTQQMATDALKAGTQLATEPPPSIKAFDLGYAYEENEIAADAKYKGKTFTITGKIKNLGKDESDNCFISLVLDPVRSIHCDLKDSPDEVAKASKLERGDPVTIIGTVDGLNVDIQVKEADIIPGTTVNSQMARIVTVNTSYGNLAQDYWDKLPGVIYQIDCLNTVSKNIVVEKGNYLIVASPEDVYSIQGIKKTYRDDSSMRISFYNKSGDVVKTGKVIDNTTFEINADIVKVMVSGWSAVAGDPGKNCVRLKVSNIDDDQ